jgi:gas vesicle protein
MGHEYEHESDGGGSSSFGWFVAGLGLGALLGVLYAPKSGRETREELAANAREGGEFLRRKGYEMRDQAGHLVDQGREQFDEYYQRGREQFDEYVQAGKEYYAKGLDQINEYVDKGRNLAADQANRVQAAVEAGKEAYRTTAAGTDGASSPGHDGI